MAASPFPSTSTTNGFTRPRQKLTSAQKTEQWKKDCVMYFTSQGYQEMANGRNSKQEKQVNYNLKNSIIDPAQFEYVTDSLGLGGEFGGNPAQLVMKNLIGPKIDRLTAEEMMRPFNWMARGMGGGVMTARAEEKRRLVGEYFTAMYQNIQAGGTGSEEELAQQGVKIPKAIEKYMKSEYLDPREVTANQILEYLIKAKQLPQKFNQMFTDALITSEEYGYVGIVKGDPDLRVTNPLNFRFPYSEDLQWTHKAEWGVEERWLYPTQVMDLYQEFLSDGELDNLDDGSLSQYFNGFNSQALFVDLYSPTVNALRPHNGVMVQTCCWRSWKKVGFFSYPDPTTGEWQKTTVDDSFTIPKSMALTGATVEWEWQEEIWTGTRIGRDTVVDVRPLEFQMGYLPWVGFIHNNRNSKATSIVDLVKEDQFSYMITWWKLEMEIAKYKGSRMLYDVAMLPTTGPNAMSMNQFLYYGETVGIQFYNSMAEGPNGRPLGNAGGNMMQEINLSNNGGWINALLGVLAQIEARIDALTGVSRQREGDVKASESATGVTQAVNNSAMVTEPWFYNHNLVKGEVLTMLVEVAKEAYKDGTTLPLVVDEVYNVLNVDGETFPDSHYGVFLSNSSKDWSELQEVKQYFMAAAQKGLLPMSSIAEAIKAKSPEQMVAAMKVGEQTMQENQQASQKAASDQAKELEGIRQQTLQMTWNNENQQKELDRQNKIQVATISSLKGKDGPSDVDGDGIADPIQQAELALKMSAHNASLVAQNQKASADLQKTGLQHQATMRKLDLEAEKVAQKSAEVNLKHAQFTREQDQQDHNKKLDLTSQKVDKQTKEKELALKAKDLATKQATEKAKLAQDNRNKEAERKLQLQLHASTLAHQTQENAKDRETQVKLVKLKPKPSPGK
ncbi:hypothetical protein Q5H92_14705 [Hymenobacter sp. M29]|uniref:Portal protein n=1 Tax=Hymenobacter mellowenesis TaxID=3063995 RepID=A0ABT9ACN9_9BACT|nr:hypothetical protein [Hymenobacter sp. M29]MDO7847616.1 hypothetical protein [Hymenobacter sp. M29]